MNLITIKNVRGYVENEKVFLNLEDVAKGLGFEKTEIKNEKEYKSIRWARIRKYLGIDYNLKYITKEQLQKLVQNTTKPLSKEWYELAGLQVNHVILSKEQETIGFICDCFKDITQINLQHKIGNYKIDLYFPEYNLAVECDEFNHSDRDEKYETEREKFIKQELGCKFIRFNPDSNGFKISDILNRINKYVIKR